ncbi:MAG: hypothetical protein AAFY35_04525 [Pseudomonadota bacterium]
MTTNPETKLDERMSALEAKVAAKPRRAFPTTTVLAVLPVGFGLYQFHLSNEFKKEDNQTRALLAALEGETPSDICGNLSLLVQGGLVTDDRLVATESLIAEITAQDGQTLDGGVTEFDCLPRIAADEGDRSPAPAAAQTVSLADRLAAPSACFYDTVEIEVIPTHDPDKIARIAGYLERENVIFAAMQVDATEWEINNYSGNIWYYSIESRQCAVSIARGLEPLGITLSPRYYTREGLPEGLPIRIWPNL